jgi:hypothetical protein
MPSIDLKFPGALRRAVDYNAFSDILHPLKRAYAQQTAADEMTTAGPVFEILKTGLASTVIQ